MMIQVLISCWFLAVGSHGSLATWHPPSEDKMIKKLEEISEQITKWESFYMGRLEPRMIGAATSLANLDTNIKNLQERAHVWDTFQHHVAAWNAQISALDHKIDIMKNGQDKQATIDEELVSLVHQNKEIARMLSLLDGRIDIFLGLKLDGKEKNDSVDKKLDEIINGIENIHGTAGSSKKSRSHEALTSDVKCSSNDVLQDIATKVDLLLDRASDVQRGDEVELRHMGRSCRLLMAPYKKLLGVVETLQEAIKELSSGGVVSFDPKAAKSERLRSSALDSIKRGLDKIDDELDLLRKRSDRNINENERLLKKIYKKLEKMVQEDEEDEEGLEKSLKKFIVNQRRRMEKNIKKAMEDHDDSEDDDDDDDDDDSNDRKRKNDSDDDDDDDDDDDKKSRRRSKSKHDSRDDDDDDDDDDKEDSDDDNDDDDDDDDTHEDDSDDKHKKSKNDSDDDDDDDDSNHSKHKKRRKSSKKHDNNSKDDDDEDDEDDDDDDDDENDSRKNDYTKPEAETQRSPNMKKEVELISTVQKTENLAAVSPPSKILGILASDGDLAKFAPVKDGEQPINKRFRTDTLNNLR